MQTRLIVGRAARVRRALWSAVAGITLAIGIWSTSALAQSANLTGAERAAMVLTTAKSAFNDQNYEVAAGQFREYLKNGGPKADVLAARYGLGVSLIEGPAKDYRAAVDALSQPASLAGFKDRAFAFYYLGVGYRGLAEQKADGAPAPQGNAGGTPAPLNTAAAAQKARRLIDQNLTSAATNFGSAAEAFVGLAPAVISADKELPAEWEWVAKARCDQADILLRLGQFKPAATAAAAVIDDAKLSRSRYRAQAAYQLGYANFGLKDYGAAVRVLSSLAPFDQGEIAVHARFLLGRAHHLAGERPEAVTDYQAVVSGWEQLLKETRIRLAEQGVAAAEKERLSAILKAPTPDYVARAMFYWGVVLSEFGSVDDSVAKFLAVVQIAPQSPVAAEARIRAAQSAVQVKKYHEAADAVTPLVDDSQWGLEALRYLAKAQYGIGTTPVPKGGGQAAILNAVADPAALAAAIKQAIVTLQKSEDRAKAMPVSGAKMPVSHAIILLELGDMLQLDRRYADAAVAYASASATPALEIAEPALERQAVALQLAGEFAAADKACGNFLDKYPKSELRAEVNERYAENALLAAQKTPAAGNLAKHVYDEAISRFNRVIQKFPDAPQANLARMGLATIQYLQANFAEAANLLNKIPESDRVDDLVGVGFLLADCQLRALPDTADDALSSSRAAAQLETITTQLESYVASRPNAPEAADAMIRVGYASVKLSNLLADPAEKRRTLAKARRSYITLMQDFPDHPLYPVALLENAKLLTQMSGGPQAVLELSKFDVEPLNKTAIAPLALIHLADAQRTRRQPEEAIRILSTLRAEHEAELLKDPQRAQWVPVLQYSLALSYKEAGKYEQAKELFTKLAKDFPKRPEAMEAAWRIAQCATDPAVAEVEGNRRALAAAVKAETQQDVLANLLEATKKLRTATEQMSNQAAAIAAKVDDSDLPQKMNYDAAWCWKSVGDVEVEAARRSLQAQAVHKMMEKLQQDDPGHAVQAPRPPEIPLASIPLQPGEKLAREKFKVVIEAAGDSPLVDEARLELAEIYMQREEADAAIDLLKEAVAKDPNSEMAERIKIRLATLQLTKGDPKAAAALANEVLALPKSSYAPYARVIATEAAYQQKNWDEVIETARPFLEATRGIGRMNGVSDHALLRMADAQGQQRKWQDARDTLDAWFVRFPSGQLNSQAKFAYGWVNENLKDVDRAATAYSEVAAKTGGELGAKSNLQLGRLRMQQNRPGDALPPLLAVAYAYDDPELSPAAMCEAAKALVQLNKPADARRLLERAVKEYASSTWAAAAKKQLGEMK